MSGLMIFKEGAPRCCLGSGPDCVRIPDNRLLELLANECEGKFYFRILNVYPI